MRITKNKLSLSYDYHISQTKLDVEYLHRDLLLLTRNKLSWNDHTANITAKTFRIMSLIKRMYRDFEDGPTLQTFFTVILQDRSWNMLLKSGIHIRKEAINPTESVQGGHQIHPPGRIQELHLLEGFI